MTGRCTKKEGKRAKAERSKESRETQTGGQKKCKRGGTQKKIKLIRRNVKKLTTDLPHLCSWLHKLCILLFQILSIMPHSFDCPSLPAQFSVPLSLPCKRHSRPLLSCCRPCKSSAMCSTQGKNITHLVLPESASKVTEYMYFLSTRPKSPNVGFHTLFITLLVKDLIEKSKNFTEVQACVAFNVSEDLDNRLNIK